VTLDDMHSFQSVQEMFAMSSTTELQMCQVLIGVLKHTNIHT